MYLKVKTRKEKKSIQIALYRIFILRGGHRDKLKIISCPTSPLIQLVQDDLIAQSHPQKSQSKSWQTAIPQTPYITPTFRIPSAKLVTAYQTPKPPPTHGPIVGLVKKVTL